MDRVGLGRKNNYERILGIKISRRKTGEKGRLQKKKYLELCGL